MKIGVVIVTHYGLAEEFLHAVDLIVPDAPKFHTVAIEPGQGVDEMRATLEAALTAAENGSGVLVLTDMFGGTPSNISLSFLENREVEVVTGVNLPMLIKLATVSDEMPLEELARLIKEYGRRNISVARELLPEDDA